MYIPYLTPRTRPSVILMLARNKIYLGKGGPLDLGHFPDSVSAGPERQDALKLKQKHIDNFRISINGFLGIFPVAQQTM